MNISDTTEEDSETHKPVDGGEIKIEFFSDYFHSPDQIYYQEQKKACKKFGPVQSLSDNSECFVICDRSGPMGAGLKEIDCTCVI
jgi:hypothetical protein